MPNHTFQILRLLRFAGLMLLLGSVASASAQTVGERLKKDPDFRIYAVFTYFFYVPGHPNVVVTDLDKPLDKQP